MRSAEPVLVLRATDADDLTVRVLEPRTWFDDRARFTGDPLVTLAVESPSQAVWAVEYRMTQQMAMSLAAAIDLVSSIPGRHIDPLKATATWFSITSEDDGEIVMELADGERSTTVRLGQGAVQSIGVELRSAALAKDVSR